MARTLSLDTSSATPIWGQIEQQMRLMVASGALEPGAAVPSVRELAKQLTVNPATVSKAYQRLTEAGVFTVRRGEGTFVAIAPPRLESDQARSHLHHAARRFATDAQLLGASLTESEAALRNAWPGPREDSEKPKPREAGRSLSKGAR